MDSHAIREFVERDWQDVAASKAAAQARLDRAAHAFARRRIVDPAFIARTHYLRDRSGREVDFLLTVSRKPWVAVEAKVSETRIDSSLLYFRDRLKIPFAYQVVLDGTRDFVERGVRCLPATDFLAALI